MSELNETIKAELQTVAEPKYRDFSSALAPTLLPVLGVRLPYLRQMAKRLSQGDWQTYLVNADNSTFEEVILQGMTIGLATERGVKKGTMTVKDTQKLIAAFVPKIDGWSVCDTFCCGLKVAKNNPDFWSFVVKYAQSDKPFYVRFGVVMMLSYYITPDYIDGVLDLLPRISIDHYYVRMGVAWALSVCYVKFPAKTLPIIKSEALDRQTQKMAIQKCFDSFRVSEADKQALR